MSVIFIIGRPRSGKSYFAVDRYILPTLKTLKLDEPKQWWQVCTNITGLDTYAIADYLNVSELVVQRHLTTFKDPREMNFRDLTPQTLILIDEVQKFYPALTTPEKGQSDFLEDFKNYLTEHGKYIHDVVLITQNWDNCAGKVKRTTDSSIKVHPLKNLGLANKARYLRYDEDDFSKEMGRGMFSYKPEIYRLYQSYNADVHNGGFKENKRPNIGFLFTGQMLFALALLVALVAMVYKNRNKSTLTKLVNNAETLPEKMSTNPPGTSILSDTIIYSVIVDGLRMCKTSSGWSPCD